MRRVDGKEDLMKLIKIVTEKHNPPIVGALASYVYRRTDLGEAVFATARWLFLTEAETPKIPLNYKVLLMGEEWIPKEKLLERIEELFTASGNAGGGYEQVEFQRCYGLRSFPEESHENLTGWPEWDITIRRKQNTDFTPHRSPVVAPGLPPYNGVGFAVEDYVWNQKSSWRADRDRIRDENEIKFYVPDRRARIKNASWEGNTIQVNAETNVADGAIELQGSGYTSEGAFRNFCIAPNGGRLVLDEDLSKLTLYLIDKDSFLLDSMTLKRPGDEYTAGPHSESLEMAARKELEGGECDTVEFKPFIDLDKANDKRFEIVKSAVSFSNTNGGRIYVGVDDAGNPQSEATLKKCSKAGTDEALEKQKAFLEKQIREKTKPVLDFSISAVEVFGEHIIVVSVEKGSDGPYATQTNDIFIRKGATNRKPDPKTELPALISNKNNTRSWI